MKKLLTFMLLSTHLFAAEIDIGLLVGDNDPWKISWIQESNHTWVLSARFDKGELNTFFQIPPPSIGLGLSADNKPIKQELVYYPSGATYISYTSQFEQWLDGAKGWTFLYDNIVIKTKNDKFVNCTTAIIQEVGCKKDEIRYFLFKYI